MLKVSSLAATAIAVCVIGGAAQAADLKVFSPTNPVVHVLVAGKSSAQISADVLVAAKAVCGESDLACVRQAYQAASDEVRAFDPASGSDMVAVARADGSTVHVALTGRSIPAVYADIVLAAETVCRASNAGEATFAACVRSTVNDARAQLRFMDTMVGRERIASN